MLQIIETENYFHKSENEKLKRKLCKISIAFSFEIIFNSNELFNVNIDVPNAIIFNLLLELFRSVNFN